MLYLFSSFYFTPFQSSDVKFKRDITNCSTLRSPADLTHTCLSHADLTNTDLTHVGLSHADLSYTDLTHAGLSHADLSYTDLAHADIAHTDLAYTDLTHADLAHAGMGIGLMPLNRCFQSIQRCL